MLNLTRTIPCLLFSAQLIAAAVINTTKVNICRVENLAAGGENGGEIIRLCNIVSEYGPSDNLMMAHIPDNIPDHSFIQYSDHHTSEGEDGLLHFSISEEDDIDFVSEKEVRRLVAVKARNEPRRLQYQEEKTMLVVMVNSGRLTVTQEEVTEKLFGNQNSMASQLKACSQNQVSIKPLDPAVIEMKTEKPITEYRFMQLWRELGPKLRQQYGKSATSPIREIADHVFFVLPDTIQAPPGQTAWAAIPGNYLGVMNRFVPSVMNTLHELGHNFGLAHGYENGVEYDDQSTAMGTQQDKVKICFNGYHMKHMDWFWDRSHEIPTISNNGEIVNVAYFGNYRLTSADQPVWVSIGDFDIFLSFNRKKGINADTIEHGDKLLVNQKRLKDPESITPYTELLAALDVDSEPFTLPNYQNGASLVIQVCSFTPQGPSNPDYLTVAVGTRVGLCSTATQAPNLNTDFPTMQPKPTPTDAAPEPTQPEPESETATQPESEVTQPDTGGDTQPETEVSQPETEDTQSETEDAQPETETTQTETEDDQSQSEDIQTETDTTGTKPEDESATDGTSSAERVSALAAGILSTISLLLL